ncbi:glycosyltransferase family 4 protein [Skermania sp. ID1734]|uniref:glycosyltransferase n=1 Tax=Skermania sp. ID1734 TaxID=2597516 RepID=UPI00118091C0|nr:glycosyltransferase [Skermania sp. ID1734]TSE00491.1 glycosyltransferase family 4 protein [Skermania sp. ID1734]
MTLSRVAIVHERWTERGGAENVVQQLAMEWPEATVYVPFADPTAIPPALEGRMRVTALDRLHRATGRQSHAPLLPLVPRNLRALDFGDADAVIISHHALALAAASAAMVPTIAYVHSPARWAWDPAMRRGETSSRVGRAALSALARQTVRTESLAAGKVTAIVANSREVARRIEKWWGRSSVVVHPPVNTDRFVPIGPAAKEDFFLLAGRLVPYKRADLAVRAARRAGVRLVVAGDGRSAAQCKAIAGPETTFLGRVSDAELVGLQQKARALIMPGVEDFGIVPVEAMACGTPVIALGAGGSLDTVIPDVSGILIEPGEDEAVVDRFAAAMRGFRPAEFNDTEIRRHAEAFSEKQFRIKMREVVSNL